MARRNGQLPLFNTGEASRTQAADAVNHLLRDGIIDRASLIVLAARFVIDQACGEKIGVVIVEIVKELTDVLAHGDFKLHAQIVGKGLA